MSVFRIENLESEMYDRLASDNEDLRNIISSLKSEINLKNKKHKELESQNKELRKVITNLKSSKNNDDVIMKKR